MRSKLLIFPTVLVVALIALAAGVHFYDAGRPPQIAPGIRVAGIDVGGLKAPAARTLLARRFEAALRRPVVVHHGRGTWTLGPREARVRSNVAAMVDQAVARSDEGGVLRRTLRRLRGGRIQADLRPRVSYSHRAVVRLVDRVRRSVGRPATDATLTVSAAGPKEVADRRGLRVRTTLLRREIARSLRSPDAARTFVAQTTKIAPRVTAARLLAARPVALVADRATFQLRVYRDLRLVKTYGIAVGSAGHDTPAGSYTIQNKAVDPAWHVPNSPWAGDLAGKVIPGGVPENPIRARWLGIADGVGIHGTTDRASIGQNASHGCLRMREEDVIDLYPKVPVGSPIYIV